MNFLRLSSILAIVLVLSFLCVPAYADEVSPSDEIGNFSDEYWSDIIDSLDDPESSIFDFSSAIDGVHVALLFVSTRVSLIWKAIPDAFMVVLTLPIMIGVFFYLCSHVRIPDTCPEPGDYSTSETWTTTVTSKDGGAEHTIESHTITNSRRI